MRASSHVEFFKQFSRSQINKTQAWSFPFEQFLLDITLHRTFAADYYN